MSSSEVEYIEVCFRMVTEKTFTMKLDPLLMVSDVKALIESESDILPSNQRLIFKGQVLKDDCTLCSYNVESGSTIHVVGRVVQDQNSGETNTNTNTNTNTCPQSQYTYPRAVASSMGFFVSPIFTATNVSTTENTEENRDVNNTETQTSQQQEGTNSFGSFFPGTSMPFFTGGNNLFTNDGNNSQQQQSQQQQPGQSDNNSGWQWSYNLSSQPMMVGRMQFTHTVPDGESSVNQMASNFISGIVNNLMSSNTIFTGTNTTSQSTQNPIVEEPGDDGNHPDRQNDDNTTHETNVTSDEGNAQPNSSSIPQRNVGGTYGMSGNLGYPVAAVIGTLVADVITTRDESELLNINLKEIVKDAKESLDKIYETLESSDDNNNDNTNVNAADDTRGGKILLVDPTILDTRLPWKTLRNLEEILISRGYLQPFNPLAPENFNNFITRYEYVSNIVLRLFRLINRRERLNLQFIHITTCLALLSSINTELANLYLYINNNTNIVVNGHAKDQVEDTPSCPHNINHDNTDEITDLPPNDDDDVVVVSETNTVPLPSNEVQSNSLPPEVSPAVSSSNYLSLKSIVTPGDRGEGSDGSSIMGMMEDGAKVVLDVTSSGEPVADLREAEGEVNREAPCNAKDGRTSSGDGRMTSGGSYLQDNERTSSVVNHLSHDVPSDGDVIESIDEVMDMDSNTPTLSNARDLLNAYKSSGSFKERMCEVSNTQLSDAYLGS